MTDPETRVIQTDARGRISLGDMMTSRFYFAKVDDKGVITLRPAVVVPLIGKEAEGEQLP